MKILTLLALTLLIGPLGHARASVLPIYLKLGCMGALTKVPPFLRKLVDEVHTEDLRLIGDLKVPTNLRLVVFSGMDGPIYCSAAGFIGVSRIHAFDSSDQGRLNLRAILQHEFGHAVFRANAPDLISRQISPDQSALKKFVQLFAAPSQNGLEWLNETMGLQEIFADTLAVLGSGDPDAVSKSLIFLGAPTREMRNRMFSGTVFDANWSEEAVHDIYGPTRRFLWEHYLSQPSLQGQEPQFVRALLGVLIRDFEELYLSDGSLDTSAGAKNTRLMNRMVRELGEFDSP